MAVLANALSWLLVCGVLAATTGAVLYWRRRPSARPVTPTATLQAAVRPIVYRDAPTVRLVDAQRVDRIRKILHLRAGEHADVLETLGAMPVRFRITLKQVRSAVVRLSVDLDGATFCCGPLAKQVGAHEFEAPRAGRDEALASLFHFHESTDALELIRIKVRNIDPQAAAAEIDVLQVTGHWPAGREA